MGEELRAGAGRVSEPLLTDEEGFALAKVKATSFESLLACSCVHAKLYGASASRQARLTRVGIQIRRAGQLDHPQPGESANTLKNIVRGRM